MSNGAKMKKKGLVGTVVKEGCARSFMELGNPFWSAENVAYRTTKAGTEIESFLGEIKKALIGQIESAFNAGWDFSECEYGKKIALLKKEIARLKKEAEEQRQALSNQQEFIDELMTIDWEGE